MTYQREHRLDDRKLDSIADELERFELEVSVPGKQTRTELFDRIAAAYRGSAAGSVTGPGRCTTSVAKPGFHDFQALALRDVLSRLGNRRALREAALAAADPRIAARVAKTAPGDARLVDPVSGASGGGQGLWQAAQRRAVTLYRRANAAGAVSPRSSDVDAALAAIGSGAALPRDICQMLEPVFGVRLDRVRIHSGAVAQRACNAVSADAFTVGEDIFLPAWDPRSSACRELLAHELVHCVQWWQGRIGPDSRRGVSRPTDALEQEADRFVRTIDFAQLDRREPRDARGGAQLTQRPTATKRPTASSIVAPRDVAPRVPLARTEQRATGGVASTTSTSSAVAPSLDAARAVTPSAVAPSIALQAPHAPRTPAPLQMVMRRAQGDDLDQYGLPKQGSETWNSANWQYWKDLAASMWRPPIDKVLKQHAQLLADNVWWVVGGLTLAVGVAYLAIIATGIVAATAAVLTWIGTWGLPAWAAEEKVREWLEQVENVKGDPHQAAIAKEKFAEVVVTVALLAARMKAGAARQTDGARTATTYAARSGAATKGELEAHVPAGAGGAKQLPAVPNHTKQLPADGGSAVKRQLPAIGATPSLIGPPTEQQFLELHPMVGGAPEPAGFSQVAPTSDAVMTLIKNAPELRIIVDYDGTLVPIQVDPEACAPDAELIDIFDRLAKDPKIKVMVNSGRPPETLEKWVGRYPFAMAAEHGAWSREAKVGAKWQPENLGTEWKSSIRSVMERYVQHTPGSSIETKDFCLVWHYRKAALIEQKPGKAKSQATALVEELGPVCSALGLEILDGDMVIEVKPKGINKGTAADRFVSHNPLVVHIVAGDDATDEHMFSAMPEGAITIKVGTKPSISKYRSQDVASVRAFLRNLVSER